ncbi:MAG: single-stranded DNA-binding protein [Defluviitaleaceae bacterium]|nr:single-stranded DNA-binding protein [Defluviitaleaceae bacterium]
MNKVILMGRLTRDPEVRYSQSAEPIAVARYSLAVNKRFKRDGEPDANFINCVAFGKTGEFAERFFKKGMMVCVSGRLEVRSWDDQQTGQRRYSTDVVIEEQDFAESKASFQARGGGNDSFYDDSMIPPNVSGASSNKGNSEPAGFSAITDSIDDDDLPF